MRVRLLALFLLLLACFVSAEDEWLNYKNLNLELDITNSFDISSRSSFTNIQEASALLSWYPIEDYRQTILETTTHPSSSFSEDGFLFEWNNPKSHHFEITLSSKINTSSDFRKISTKVNFPLENVPYEYSDYLKAYEITDSNAAIASIAASLAKGEDDAFVVVSKLAEWVETNVEYDLSSTTADASQKSSWVLENRIGVCDELTSLFISMVRSVGIPARFVSGVSYSNINLENNGWGPHGWAEVYFPEVGWAPVDVTYKELGYVDSTHIKLKVSPDAKESSLHYSVTGQGTDIIPGELNFSVTVLGGEQKNNDELKASISILEEEVGLGSYNLVSLSIKNPNKYYASGKVYLLNVSGIDILDSNAKSFIMAPKREEKFYWKIKVSEKLDKNYIYTFPISARVDLDSANLTFVAYSKGKVLSQNYVDSFVPSPNLARPEDIIIFCSANSNEIYLNELTNVSCTVKNLAKSSRNFDICLDNNCSRIALSHQEQKEFNYSVKFNQVGITTARFRAKNTLSSGESYLVFEVKDKPSLAIQNMTVPKEISFDDSSAIRFVLAKYSASTAENVKLTLDNGLATQDWEIESIDSNYEISFMFSGHDLELGENTFNLKLEYYDNEGRTYIEEKPFVVKLTEHDWRKRILSGINVINIRINRWVESNLYKQSSTQSDFKLLLKKS